MLAAECRFKMWRSAADGMWYWSLVQGDGKTICIGSSYATRQSCIKYIEVVRDSAASSMIEEVNDPNLD